jgi:hypothetical protein
MLNGTAPENFSGAVMLFRINSGKKPSAFEMFRGVYPERSRFFAMLRMTKAKGST